MSHALTCGRRRPPFQWAVCVCVGGGGGGGAAGRHGSPLPAAPPPLVTTAAKLEPVVPAARRLRLLP
jgi:hypothetical protein